MDKTTEFRLGNIVIFSGEYRKIESICEDSIILDGCRHLVSDIGPVNLDRQVLLLCGFKPYYKLFEYPQKRFFPFLLKAKDNGAGYNLLLDYRPVTCMDFVCLHQLQNLFFAFTGEELPLSTDSLEGGRNSIDTQSQYTIY